MNVSKALISKLGPIAQMGFVHDDLEGPLRFWTETMGVGPFRVIEHLQLPDGMRYKGARTDVIFTQALGYWGDMQIELMRMESNAPSIFKDWLDQGKNGLHHVAIFLEDMDHARDICAKAGAPVIQEAKFPGGEVAFVDTGGGPGTIVELLAHPPGVNPFEQLQAISREWDGSDPIRYHSLSLPDD